jgi:hypothetical protein
MHLLFFICENKQGTEKYVMTKLHDLVFARYRADRERDEGLAARLRALQFLEPGHLEIPEDKVNSRGKTDSVSCFFFFT